MKEKLSVKIGIALIPYSLAITLPLFLYNWAIAVRDKKIEMGREPFIIGWLAIIALLAIISLFFSSNFTKSIGGLFLLLIYLFLFFVGKYLIRNTRKVLEIYLYSLSFINFFGIIQWIFKIKFLYSYGPIYINIDMPGGRISSLTANPNILAMLASVSVLIALGLYAATRGKIWHYPLLGLLGLITLLLTQSRGALIGTILGVFLIFLFYRKKKILFFIAAGLLLALLIPGSVDRLAATFTPHADELRKSVWQSSLQMIHDRPLFGFGPQTFQESYQSYKLPSDYANLIHPHNVFLRNAIEWGLPFAVIFLSGTLILAVLPLWRRSPAYRFLFPAIFSYFIVGLFDDPLYFGQLSSGFWLMLGMMHNKHDGDINLS